MTHDDLNQRLQDELEVLQKQMTEMGFDPETGDPVDVDFDHGFADSGHATAEKSNVLSLAEGIRDNLREVREALTAISNGSYGTCAECGNEIPADRLDARPQSRLCIGCKQLAG